MDLRRLVECLEELASAYRGSKLAESLLEWQLSKLREALRENP